jgi:predicted ATPase
LEAVAHCTKGIGLVEKLSETDELARRELDLCLTLGTSLISAKGYTAPEVARVYGRARKLCEQVGDTEQLFPVIFGQFVNRQQTGQHATAKALAAEALALAETQNDSGFLLQGHHATWTTLFAYSDLLSCLRHAEQGTIIYDIDKHRSHAFLYGGHDPGVCGWNHVAVSRWFLGYPDQAIEAARTGTALAKQLSHPFSQVLSFAFSSFLHQYRRDPVATRESAEAAITLCEVQGVAPNYAVIAHILRGWSVAAIGEQDGLAEITQGVADWRATGANLRLSYLLGMMAEAYGWAGQPAEGLKAVSEALDTIETSGEGKWEPELHRLKGELLLSVSPSNQSEAEGCFKKATETARALSATSLELRAATSLARLRFDQGRTGEARDMLASLYDWFTEGFDTPDLKDAKALLNELS